MEKRAAGFVIFRRLSKQIEYLLLQASYGQHHWTPPKGHVDPGEDDFTTALRETREETGYTECDLRINKDFSKTLKYKVKGNPKTVVYWPAELLQTEKEPVLSEEHDNFKWLPKDEAKALSGYADMQELIECFHSKIDEMKD